MKQGRVHGRRRGWSQWQWLSCGPVRTYHRPVSFTELPDRTGELLHLWCFIDQQCPCHKEVSSIRLAGTVETVRASHHPCFCTSFALPENLRRRAAAPLRWRSTVARSRTWSRIWTSLLSCSCPSSRFPPWRGPGSGCNPAVSWCTVFRKWLRPLCWC